MHPQDRLLVAEALVVYSAAGDEAETSGPGETPRQRRAWGLAADLLAIENLGFNALVTQVDAEWSGPERSS